MSCYCLCVASRLTYPCTTSGLQFRSYAEVYRHLGLPVNLGPPAQMRENKRSQSSLVGDEATTGDQQAGDAIDSNPDPQGTTHLPEALQKIPITCNSKHGTWHVTLNKVECRETNCPICGDKAATARFMARSGAQGFTMHAGLSVHSYWKNVFKVDLPDAQGWSLEKHFQQHNCSLTSVLQAGSPPAAHGRSEGVNRKTSTASASVTPAKAAKRHKPVIAARQLAASPDGRLSRGKQHTSTSEETAGEVQVNGNLQSEEASGSGTPDTCCEQPLPNAVANADGKSGGVSAAKQVTEEISKLQARHDAEVKKLRAQVARGRTEYEKAVEQIGKLSKELYDVKTGNLPSG
ncbi:hypothetical protein ABBQ38_011805 [Trebouxia sp. C0009 RCD-2024]